MTMDCQFHIKMYALKGDGTGSSSVLPYQLILRVVGIAEAGPKNVWMGDFDTIAHAKHAAVALFATVTPFDATDTYWSVPAATTTAQETLSTVFTATFAQA